MQPEHRATRMPGSPLLERPPIEPSTTHEPSNSQRAEPSTQSAEALVSRFDPKNYRQVQIQKVDDSGGWGRKQQTIIPVRKPSRKQFVHVHPSADFRADGMPTIEDETTGDVYLLSAGLDLPVDIENKVDMLNLATAITADGSIFLWHYKNSTNSWSQSARIAIREASRRWVRVISDKSSNGYLLESPMVSPPEPVWPLMTFTDILETAFSSRFIESLNHPMIKKLRGDFHV